MCGDQEENTVIGGDLCVDILSRHAVPGYMNMMQQHTLAHFLDLLITKHTVLFESTGTPYDKDDVLM